MRRLLAALAAVFFFTPAVVWVLGVRAKPIENRPFTQLPSLSQGWRAFDQLTQWGIDRLPLRADAIRLNTDLSKRLFHELPTVDNTGAPVGIGQGGQLAGAGNQQGQGPPPRSLQVIAGRDGWLFYGDEFVRACHPEVPLADVVARLQRLARILAASGRRFVFTVAPDKHALSARYLPGNLPERACTLRADAARRAALQAAAVPGYVDLLSALERRQRELGAPIYQPADTHWDSDGDVVFVRAMVGALDPALLRGTRFVRLARVAYVGDLAALSGAPTKTSDRPFASERAGVTAVGPQQVVAPIPNYPIATARFRAAPRGARLFGSATLVYGDSFTERALGLLEPFFRDVTRIPELSRAAVGGALAPAQARLIAEVRAHRVIVMEQAERTFWGAAVGSILDPAFLDRLARALGVPSAG